jgi:hypothetical protein
MNGNGTMLELDPATAHALNQLAEAWGVSREEVVRRVVAEAGSSVGESARPGRLQAFKELQGRLGLTPEKAAAWVDAIQDARR